MECPGGSLFLPRGWGRHPAGPVRSRLGRQEPARPAVPGGARTPGRQVDPAQRDRLAEAQRHAGVRPRQARLPVRTDLPAGQVPALVVHLDPIREPRVTVRVCTGGQRRQTATRCRGRLQIHRPPDTRRAVLVSGRQLSRAGKRDRGDRNSTGDHSCRSIDMSVVRPPSRHFSTTHELIIEGESYRRRQKPSIRKAPHPVASTSNPPSAFVAHDLLFLWFFLGRAFRQAR
jgi:hypothetical protein